MNRYRIAIVDDHALVRTGLKKIIEEVSGLEVVGETGIGSEVLALVQKAKPDLLMLDVSMPDFDVIKTLEEIKEKFSGVKVLILSMHKEFLHAALSAGASGYVMKEDFDKELLLAIENIRQGRIHLSPRLSGSMSGFQAPRDEALSAREKEVLISIAEGKSNKEIAQILSISVRTVESHRFHIMEKLGIKGAGALTMYAIRKGYIEPKQIP